MFEDVHADPNLFFQGLVHHFFKIRDEIGRHRFFGRKQDEDVYLLARAVGELYPAWLDRVVEAHQ